ncbi:MAG: polyphosphate kinase 2 family protein, partial [Alphaproteobacteria bacterium]
MKPAPYIITPRKRSRLAERDPRDRAGLPERDKAEEQLHEDAVQIGRLQERLFAEGQRALLVVLQGTDTAGKDGTIRHVFYHTSPLGVSVKSFGKPSEPELEHDYLWRVHQACPIRGTIGLFNRSHYEDVLIVRVE